MTKRNLILSGVILVLGAVLGAWAMYAIQTRLREKAVAAATETVRTERDELARQTKITALRLRIGLAAIQAGKMNYGNARTEAEAMFAEAAALEGLFKGTPDERELQMILSRKDQVLGDLAVGSPAAAVALEQIYAASSKAVTGR